MTYTGTKLTAARKEPVLELDDIQGNILLEFAKSYQTVICLRLKDDAKAPKAVETFKQWLNRILDAGWVTASSRVVGFRERVADHFRNNCGLQPPRAGSRRLADPTGLRPRTDEELRIRDAWQSLASFDWANETWVQIGFSHACLKRLDPRIAYGQFQFKDEAFTTGMAGQSAYLGDPQISTSDGHVSNWKVGGSNDGRRADVFLLVADDDCVKLEAALGQIRTTFGAVDSPADIIYEESANLIDAYMPEHFRHGDGFSQPGILGLAAGRPGGVLTQRVNPIDSEYQGLPGQQLIWPGSFVLGYVNQSDGEKRPSSGDKRQSLRGIAPAWARNGSYLVFRRLEQNVPAYLDFLQQQAADHGIKDGEAHLAAMLMGRWRNGAPVVRAPTAADAVEGLEKPCTSNHFDYQATSPQLPAKSKPTDPQCTDFGYGPLGSTDFDGSPGDDKGDVCPFIGHIRKMYPRDDTAGHPPDPQSRRLKSEVRRILRRGLRYGPYWDPTDEDTQGCERGMLFLAYQASITNQFVWLIHSVANQPDQPLGTPPELQGLDPIIGQNGDCPDRHRTFPVKYKNSTGTPQVHCLKTETDWVVPRGGEYFFVPSISALKQLCK